MARFGQTQAQRAGGRAGRPARARARLRVVLLVVGLLAAVAIGAFAGWRVAEMTAERPAPPRERTLALGPASIAVAPDWEPADAAPAAPGRDPERAAAFDILPGTSAQAIVSLEPLARPDLIPESYASSLDGAAPQPREVRVAGHPAWFWSQLGSSGNETAVDLTVLPTSAGLLSIACLAPPALWDLARDCAEKVRVGLRDARPLAPSSHLALRLRLPREIEPLNRARVAGRRALRDAATPLGQARAAGGLAEAHRRAARALAPWAARSGRSRAVVDALGAIAPAYARLGEAAAQGWPRRYRLARATVDRREAALRRALERVRPLG